MSSAARVEIACLRHSPPEPFCSRRGVLSAQAGIYAPIHPWLGVAFLCVRGIPLVVTRYMRAATEAR